MREDPHDLEAISVRIDRLEHLLGESDSVSIQRPTECFGTTKITLARLQADIFNARLANLQEFIADIARISDYDKVRRMLQQLNAIAVSPTGMACTGYALIESLALQGARNEQTAWIIKNNGTISYPVGKPDDYDSDEALAEFNETLRALEERNTDHRDAISAIIKTSDAPLTPGVSYEETTRRLSLVRTALIERATQLQGEQSDRQPTNVTH